MSLPTLNTSGYLFTEVACEWNVLTADLGDGYEVGATVGHPEGTRTWAMKLDVLPGDDRGGLIEDDLEPEYMLTEDGGYVLTEGGGRIVLERPGSSRAQYLWRFFRVSKAAGNQPFWFEMEDPDDGTRKLFLASFVDHRLSYEVLCAKIYSTGLQLKQRRVRDVESPIAVA
jgi:hypothetical protein